MARANPQWKQFKSDQEALAIFHGPHSYVSPSWYATEPAVPTWNYAVVHAYGIPRILDDHDRVVGLLDETVKAYESAFDRPWPGILPDEFRDQLIRSIVAFEMPISRIEGKFKLGQNRSDEDRQGVFDSLSQSSDCDARELAKLMWAEGVVDSRPQNGLPTDDLD
jgi:transcriptional regulator